MAQAEHDDRTADAGVRLTIKDKMVIGLIVFFTAVALTLELYWLIFNQEMEARSDLFASLLALYWPADITYRVAELSVAKSFTLALEGVNTFITPWLSLVLVWAILKRKPYRYPLQLTIAAYTFYGTLLYYMVAHISGYAVFEDKDATTFLLFYLVNAPWFIGYAWLGLDAFHALARPEAA
jgi:hypothetical protein